MKIVEKEVVKIGLKLADDIEIYDKDVGDRSTTSEISISIRPSELISISKIDDLHGYIETIKKELDISDILIGVCDLLGIEGLGDRVVYIGHIGARVIRDIFYNNASVNELCNALDRSGMSTSVFIMRHNILDHYTVEDAPSVIIIDKNTDEFEQELIDVLELYDKLNNGEIVTELKREVSGRDTMVDKFVNSYIDKKDMFKYIEITCDEVARPITKDCTTVLIK